LPAGLLAQITGAIPTVSDTNLLVGFDTSDDGAVYKLTSDLAIIQTLDFFPPMVNDPYIFGQIAAANALSDIAAMGGIPKVALNIVAFPQNDDPSVLEAILKGGADKVHEAGAVLCGGHSISDDAIKYGLSVTGIVHPDKIMYNNRCKIGDVIVLTKPLGVGILASGYNAGAVSDRAFEDAIKSMTALNHHTFKIAEKYNLSSVTDVTGFGFLGHLNEMVNDGYSIEVNSSQVPHFAEAYDLAASSKVTGGGKRNRAHLDELIAIKTKDEAIMEILFDPQTSGGLLISLPKDDAVQLINELPDAKIVAAVVERLEKNIYVR